MTGAFGTVTKGFLKRLEDLEVSGRRGDHPNNSIIKNGQNTEKSPGDLRRLEGEEEKKEGKKEKRKKKERRQNEDRIEKELVSSLRNGFIAKLDKLF